MRKIGILGGTFNPIHNGHLAIAQAALEYLKLDKVLFVPAFLPPHKSSPDIIPAKFRYEMTRLAIKAYPQFEICDFEIKQKQKSYTVYTLQYLRRKYGTKVKFYFIIGDDALAGLHRWKYINQLFRLTQFVCVRRGGYKPVKTKFKVLFVNMNTLDISSSNIRLRLMDNKPVEYLIPQSVNLYIKKHRLYRS
jgi:nicotinate-nucleotide adenylyltransferase